MQRLRTKLIASLAAGVLLSTSLALALFSTASADCYEYNANGFSTSSTPVFNNICGVPDNINNESDFVRIRPDTSGNDEDNVNNPAYTVGTLDSTCSNGTNYDVWNYLHNNASPNDNPDTDPSNPSAVAHDVQEALSASFGTNSSFTFSDTVTANNAATVTDSATLDCGANQVILSLVSGSVHIYSQAYNNGTGEWYNLPDTAVNGTTTVGSPSLGSGDMWGCWNYRILIVYQVSVKTVPPAPTPAVCSLLTLSTLNATNQTVEIEKLTYIPNSATITGASIVFSGPNNATATATLTPAQLTQINSGTAYDYALPAYGTYNAVATLDTSLGNVTSTACTASATLTPPPSTPVTPASPAAPVSPAVSTKLVNTGPGSVVGIFVGVSILGALVYRWAIARRLSRTQ